MQEINAQKGSFPYADPPGFFFFFFLGGGGGGGREGGGGGCRPACLKTTLTFFLVLNFNILHFTSIDRRSGIRACTHSSERLIPVGGVLLYFLIHMRSPRSFFAKSGSATILKNLASFENESPSTIIRDSGLVKALTMLYVLALLC